MTSQARIQDFGQGGQWSFDPKGGLSPKFAQNRGFPLKIAWKLHDFEEILGAGLPGPPGSATVSPSSPQERTDSRAIERLWFRICGTYTDPRMNYIPAIFRHILQRQHRTQREGGWHGAVLQWRILLAQPKGKLIRTVFTKKAEVCTSIPVPNHCLRFHAPAIETHFPFLQGWAWQILNKKISSMDAVGARPTEICLSAHFSTKRDAHFGVLFGRTSYACLPDQNPKLLV